MGRALIGASYRPDPCRECGGVCDASRPPVYFCSQKCRNAFANRRATRGALLYDFFMELRYRRAGAKGLWSMMCRLGEEWKQEDVAHRHGFQSWRDPRRHIERNPHLNGKKGRI